MRPDDSIHQKAFQEIIKLVGSEFFKIDQESIAFYSRSTLSKGTIPSAIVRPKNKLEVQKIIILASKYSLSVHPISTGKNWGYSDACAPGNGMIILDLARMNTICEVNEDLCYATIEPGVTQGQLYNFLKEKKINLWMDATGAGADTSIVGNVLERGFGHSPYGDRFNNSCAYEIILSNGEMINTGFGHYKNSKVTNLYKWGIGPSIDGLFTQSNLGIITKMTIWLLPKPSDFKVHFFLLNDNESISEFIEKTRPLKLDKTLQSVLHMSNDLRVLSTLQRFPTERTTSNPFLSDYERKGLLKKYKIGSWFGTAGFYGSKAQNKANINKLKKEIKKIKGLKICFTVDEATLILLEKMKQILSTLGYKSPYFDLLKKIRISFELLQGKSPRSSISGGLWKVKPETSQKLMTETNPLDYNSGFYWISSILPMTGSEVKKLNSLVEHIFNEYGFDFLQTLSMVSDRSLCSVMTISFNKENMYETINAEKCHNKVVKTLIEEGYILYRAGNQSLEYIGNTSEYFFEFLQTIKKAVDPNNTISPGKYIPI